MSLSSSLKFLIWAFFLGLFQLETNAFFNPFQLAIPSGLLEDAQLNTIQLISKYGYPAENYTVQSDDGYLLGLFRIARPGALPVLLVHGLLDSSDTWVMMGPASSLGYMLYEQGYDVWMANVRGNTYSKRHVRYSAEDSDFWNFSFHEMGVFDLPAIIDFVLMQSGFGQLHYIGHSQGSTIFWILASERPKYMEKIVMMQALAPVAFLTHCRSPIVNLVASQNTAVASFLSAAGYNEFLPGNSVIDQFKRFACRDIISSSVCQSLFFTLFGFDGQQVNQTMLPIVVGHTPAGASMRQMHHYGQLRNSGKFQQFDYGLLNFLHYGSLSPPPYELEKVKAKVAIYSAKNDWLAPPEDVDMLFNRLPNVVEKYLVPNENFNHFDLVWGRDAKRILWYRMLRVMQSVVPYSFHNDIDGITTVFVNRF
ncbi:lipase 3 [Drosophila mauritiana]|uniref:Lipase n=1 Tax=Drosophila mauritiana TaxID=7226 RepID=A0A6P8KV64_DROMA|nr:lipase 3 [Drosophila mauritiana]